MTLAFWKRPKPALPPALAAAADAYEAARNKAIADADARAIELVQRQATPEVWAALTVAVDYRGDVVLTAPGMHPIVAKDEHPVGIMYCTRNRCLWDDLPAAIAAARK